ncbi:MAG: serine hydrolase, partial [Bacteroidetes bacterium]|nr:serine hydrolase [Bacteroidota bacterium]
KPLSALARKSMPQGLNTAGYGLRVKTEDIAKFGQLYLQKGQWQGKQLLPASWIEEATSKQTESQPGDGDWSQGYGYQFWRCKPGFYRGDGAYGQFCFVMPEQDAVLVMTSESKDLQKSMNIAYDNLLPAFAKGQLPENRVQVAFLKKELSQLALAPAQGIDTPENVDKYSDKRFEMAENPYGIKYLSVGLYPKNCVLKMESPKGVEKITFGWNEWVLNSQESKIRFPVPTRLEIPSKVAGSAAWLDDHTLLLKMKYVEAIHGDTLTLTFENNAVAVAFLNSVTEKTKSFPEKREKLTGTLRA